MRRKFILKLPGEAFIIILIRLHINPFPLVCMKYKIPEHISFKEVKRGLSYVIKDGVTTQIMNTLTGGVYIVAFALSLGASNIYIGLISSIPFLLQITQFLGSYLIDLFRSRKKVCIYFSFSSRVFYLLIALIPIISDGKKSLILLFIFLFAISLLSPISASSFNSWMRYLIPESIVGSFFSKRLFIASFISLPIWLFSALFIDLITKFNPEKPAYAYSIIFSIGFLIGMSGIYFLYKIPDIYIQEKGYRFKLKNFLTPFKDKNFKNFMIFFALWNFSVNLSIPFLPVYMIKRLNLPISLIVFFAVLSQLASLTSIRLWGKLSDRFSGKGVFEISAPFLLASIFLFTFTTLPEKHKLTIPLLIIIHIVSGVGNAGISVSTLKMGLKISSRKYSQFYLATMNVFNAFAAGIAPITGGALIHYLLGTEFSIDVHYTSLKRDIITKIFSLENWDFFFLLSVILGIYALFRLSSVKEKEHGEKVELSEVIFLIKTPIKNLSTIRGIKLFFTLFDFFRIKRK